MKYAFTVPILPGKTDSAREWFKTILNSRRDEWNDFQARQHVTRERYWIQSSPDGDAFIVSGEGEEWLTPPEFMDPEHNEFDRWFRERTLEITGIDLMELSFDAPEFIGEWHAPVPAKVITA